MRTAKYFLIVLLCGFLLNGCGEWESTTSPEQEEITESQEETAKNDENSSKKKKSNKKKKSSNKKKNSKKQKQKENEESYSDDSEEVDEVKNAVYLAFYMAFGIDITYEQVLSNAFETTRWVCCDTDTDYYVEFTGKTHKDGDMYEFKLHFIESYDGDYIIDDLSVLKNGERDPEYEYDGAGEDLLTSLYMKYCNDHDLINQDSEE